MAVEAFQSIHPSVSAKRFIDATFLTSQSRYLALRLKSLELPPERWRQLAETEEIIEKVDAMLQTPEDYRYQLGFLLTQLPISKIPGLERLVTTSLPSGFILKPFHKDWHLCSSSETRFAEALWETLTVEVNEKLIVKFQGRQAAICTESFTTRSGQTFVQGNWYAPVDKKLRNILTDACDKGIPQIEVEEGVWAFMREVSSDEKNPVHQVAHEAFHRLLRSHISGRFPQIILGNDRKSYREKVAESYKFVQQRSL